MDIVRDIIRHSHHLLKPQGSRELWMEVASHQPALIQQWLQASTFNNNRGTSSSIIDNCYSSSSSSSGGSGNSTSGSSGSSVCDSNSTITISANDSDSMDMKYELLEVIRDMSGHPRFVRLKAR